MYLATTIADTSSDIKTHYMINYFSFWLAQKRDRCSRMGVKRITALSSSKRAIKRLTAADCVGIKNTFVTDFKKQKERLQI